jgi:hypothetical protein
VNAFALPGERRASSGRARFRVRRGARRDRAGAHDRAGGTPRAHPVGGRHAPEGDSTDMRTTRLTALTAALLAATTARAHDLRCERYVLTCNADGSICSEHQQLDVRSYPAVVWHVAAIENGDATRAARVAATASDHGAFSWSIEGTPVTVPFEIPPGRLAYGRSEPEVIASFEACAKAAGSAGTRAPVQLDVPLLVSAADLEGALDESIATCGPRIVCHPAESVSLSLAAPRAR